MAKGTGSSYQLLRHWQSCVSSEQADVNTCQLGRDNDRVSSKEEGNGEVLPKSRKKASRSKELQSERRLPGTYIGVD